MLSTKLQLTECRSTPQIKRDHRKVQTNMYKTERINSGFHLNVCGHQAERRKDRDLLRVAPSDITAIHSDTSDVVAGAADATEFASKSPSSV